MHLRNSAASYDFEPCGSAAASSAMNWPISLTTSFLGRLTASASRRTRCMPTISPSATGASCRICSGPLMPNPMQIGSSVWVRSQATFSTRSGGRLLALAGDPGHRDVVDESRGQPGDLDGPLARRRGRDELDQLQPAQRRLASSAPRTPRPAGRARSGRRARPSPPRSGIAPAPMAVDDRVGDHRDQRRRVASFVRALGAEGAQGLENVPDLDPVLSSAR